jgi:hypothetical protein
MSESPAKESKQPTQDKELGFIFVQMLFALAIGEIARRTVLLLDGTEIAKIVPGLTHLLLALIVVATSWVGWANSPTVKDRRVGKTWSPGFFVLLIDVFLVVLYFVLACGAEKPEGGKISPSAQAETEALLWIFCVYVVWDALTKLNKTNRRSFRAYLDRSWITWACAFLAFLVWACHGRVTHPGGVIVTDAVLILIVLTFRAFKDTPAFAWRWPLFVLTIAVFLSTLCFPWIMRGQG